MSWKIFLTALASSAVVGAVITGLWALINSRVLLYTTYKLEQKKELKKLIGRYHGRMLEAAIDWDRRMNQLYENGYEHMNSKKEHRYDHEQYLYLSVVFRFLSLLGIARKFEAEAFFIDSRIASGKQLDFLRYAKGFLWVMTNSDLTEDDGMPGRDHFRNDEFRPLLDACYRRVQNVLPEDEPKANEVVFDMRRFRVLIDKCKNPSAINLNQDDKDQELDEDTKNAISQVLDFFDGIRPAEYQSKYEKDGQAEDATGTIPEYKRRRWDRIICLHLLVICFIGTFGYPWQRKNIEINLARKRAIKKLEDEAILPCVKSGSNEVCWGPTAVAFEKNLKMVGMDTSSFNQYLTYMPYMAGKKQIRQLRRDLQDVIKRLDR